MGIGRDDGVRIPGWGGFQRSGLSARGCHRLGLSHGAGVGYRLGMDPQPPTGPSDGFRPPAGLDLPFTMRFETQQALVIEMLRKATEEKSLSQAVSYAWIHGFTGSITVDMAKLVTINSMMCAWIIGLQQEAAGAKMSLINCSPRVVSVIRALRMDAFIEVRPS
jgi:hypothetical protein